MIIGGVTVSLIIGSFLLYLYIEERTLEEFVQKDIEERVGREEFIVTFIDLSNNMAIVDYELEGEDVNYVSFYMKNSDEEWRYRRTIEASANDERKK